MIFLAILHSFILLDKYSNSLNQPSLPATNVLSCHVDWLPLKLYFDFTIQDAIHICIEMPQWNSLYSYLKQTKMSFSFFKNRGHENKTGPVWGVGTSGRGRTWGKGVGRVNMVEIYVLIYEMENENCWKYSENGGRRIKESDGGMNLTKIYCEHFCKRHNGPPVQQ
jgi:hypothetical protein